MPDVVGIATEVVKIFSVKLTQIKADEHGFLNEEPE